jgi:hypothetical protein
MQNISPSAPILHFSSNVSISKPPNESRDTIPLKDFSASMRNEVKWDPFCFVFACYSEYKGPILPYP